MKKMTKWALMLALLFPAFLQAQNIVNITPVPKSMTVSEGSLDLSRDFQINMQVAYAINSWNFILYAYNPFFKNAYDMVYEQSEYEYTSHISRPRVETGNIFGLTINYRFTFGNKKHKFHEEE